MIGVAGVEVSLARIRIRLWFLAPRRLHAYEGGVGEVVRAHHAI